MISTRLIPRLRALFPGRSAATFWGAISALVALATLPFLLLAVTAPSSEIEGAVDSTGPAASISSATPPAAPATAPSPGDRTGSAEPAPTGPSPVTPTLAVAPVNQSRTAPAAAAVDLGADFDIQCWPSLAVVPGASATVECNIPVFNGDGSDISLSCKVEGMDCRLSPDKVKAVEDETATRSRLTVTAPDAAGVGVRTASVVATGGETGSALKQADVEISVPPPFSLSCESIGTSFVKGQDASIGCWISFQQGFSEEVSLAVLDPKDGATVDPATFRPVENQTKTFTILLDTSGKKAGSHFVRVGASSPKYTVETVASFELMPA